jgi:hypothetical protein
MADVFVSYAKADRSLASKLVTMLEAEGWKVWWDTSLTIGDDFRNEIMTELGRARAVIVIWTDTSIKSDWVRSEAGRAQADRKLIPVKLEHLTYKDLPPPFDILHTENVGEDDKIRAAVVAQLAKPSVQPSAAALLTKGFKYELLTWVGIIGGALTLFTNLGAVLKLADWARVLVQSWKEWTHSFWAWAFGWLGIHLPPQWTPVLTFSSFGLFLIIGQGIKYNITIKKQPSVIKYYEKSFQGISKILRCFAVIVAMIVCTTALLFFVFSYGLSVALPLWMITLYFGPQIIIILFARDRVHAVLPVILTTVFYWIIAVGPISFIAGNIVQELDPGLLIAVIFAIMCSWFLPLILLSVAPTNAVARRLIFLALGLILLLALNELSKLGLDVSAPKLHS